MKIRIDKLLVERGLVPSRERAQALILAEVKEILFAVKKRQAGKILSSLDPERAARIIR